MAKIAKQLNEVHQTSNYERRVLEKCGSIL